MEKLLIAIQNEIKTASTLQYIKDVFILPEGPDHEVIPEESRFPLIGITDGSEAIDHEPGNRMSRTRIVRISVYDELIRAEFTIVGGGGARGIVPMAEDVRKVLDRNLLGFTTYTTALSQSITASDISPFEGSPAIKKTIIFKYRSLI